MGLHQTAELSPDLQLSTVPTFEVLDLATVDERENPIVYAVTL